MPNAADFTAIQTPLILGSASLVAFVSVRGTSIADRIRSADREIVDAATVPERRKNLLFQVRGLRSRYIADTYATLSLLIAFAAFVVMGALAAVSHRLSVAAFGMGGVMETIGFVLTLYEVFNSKNTLFADLAYAEDVANEVAPANKPTIP